MKVIPIPDALTLKTYATMPPTEPPIIPIRKALPYCRFTPKSNGSVIPNKVETDAL